MAQTINTNIASLNAQRNLNSSQSTLNTSLQRLSSGLRINSAKDDAAGMAISSRMTSQINGLNQASRNANDGISLAQTAEGALQSVTESLQRMRELAVQSANATNSSTDRVALQKEVDQLVQQINTVASQTSFNGVKLLDGTFNSQAFQVGANAGETISISSIKSAKADSLGVGTTSSYSTSLSATVITGSISAGGITVNGYGIGPSVSDGVSSTQATASAISKAAAFNSVSGQTGVSAVATATTSSGVTAISAPAAIAGDATDYITINGVKLGAIAAGATNAEQANNVAAAVNAVSNQTGVTASFDTTTLKVTLTAVDGRNIDVAQGGTAVAAATGLTTGISFGGIKLTSTASQGITLGGADLAKTALTAGYTAATATFGSGVSSIDVTTASGSQNALATIDSALAQVNSSRAELGALQNRFSSVVSNLATTTENVSAARSRIVDADFAAETANLSRAQILQQAGTAMLAQANALPQNVLSLLR
ncbi:flagellin [Azonexus sp.]|jgi:flagellin|uniref:flagellin N-terminal helical domain-containing protein n=1 Tax=Azonexus sp. TaxID=1872668 RepID=UPI0035AECF47